MAPPAVTCMACNVLVHGEERKDHYRSDLHRVNLQRKVAGIAPLTLADFLQRAEVARQEEAAQVGRRGPRLCAVCSKRFSSQSALSNHIASKRHRDTARALAPHLSLEAAALGPISSPRLSSVSGAPLSPPVSDDEVDDVGEDRVSFDEETEMERRIAEAVPFAPTECAFDGRACDTIEDNLRHMQEFGFFLPFAEALRNLEGLLEYVGQKVGIGYACVECDRSFHSVAAAQQHMIDKRHCRMTRDEDVWFEEYGQFYEFAGGDEDEDSDTEGWEEVEGDEAVAVDQELRSRNADGQLVARGGSLDVEPKKVDDGYDELQKEEVEMVIGRKVIGHRSLRRYYRQNIRFKDAREAVVINKLAKEFRIMGWEGKKVAPAELRNARMATYRKNKKQLEIGIRNYYTSKAPRKVSMATFNSGYRP